MTRLTPATAIDAGALAEPFEDVPADQAVAGAPQTRYRDLDTEGDRTIGVWEHTVGVSTDVEADEVFVVLAGAGTVTFHEPALPPIELFPGAVVRLTSGMRTTWTIRETLRKVYISG